MRVVQPETENSWPFSSLVTSSSPIQPSLSSTCRWQQEEITTDNQSGWISLSPARLACSSERCRHHWRCMPCLLGRAGHSPYLTLAPLHKKWWYMTPRTAFSALWLQGKSWNIQTRLSFLLRALKLLFLAREEKASVSFPRKKKKLVKKGKKNKIKKCNTFLINNDRKALLYHLQFCHWPVCPLCSPLRSVFPLAAAPPAAPAAWGWQTWTGDPCRNSDEVNQKQCYTPGFLPYNPLLANYTKEESKELHLWAVPHLHLWNYFKK